MGYTEKPLGKMFTLSDIVQDIILWTKTETQTELDSDFVKVLVNLAVLDIAEMISGEGSSDYSKDVNITDESASLTQIITANAVYTDDDRNISYAGHGLTSSDTGKRIALWIENTRAGIAEIESIIDEDNFTVTKSLGIDGTVNYAVFSSHSSGTVDLSSYHINQVTKVYDSINKEVIGVGDKEFDNLYRFDTKQNKCFYNVRGQMMYLYKGSNVNAWGTLTMSFNSYPQKTVEDDDNLDIRDMYIPLVILKAKNFVLEHLGKASSETLNQAIESKTDKVRANIQKEKEIAAQKNYGNG